MTESQQMRHTRHFDNLSATSVFVYKVRGSMKFSAPHSIRNGRRKSCDLEMKQLADCFATSINLTIATSLQVLIDSSIESILASTNACHHPLSASIISIHHQRSSSAFIIRIHHQRSRHKFNTQLLSPQTSPQTRPCAAIA